METVRISSPEDNLGNRLWGSLDSLTGPCRKNMQQSFAIPSLFLIFGLWKMVHVLNHTSQCLLVSTVLAQCHPYILLHFDTCICVNTPSSNTAATCTSCFHFTNNIQVYYEGSYSDWWKAGVCLEDEMRSSLCTFKSKTEQKQISNQLPIFTCHS